MGGRHSPQASGYREEGNVDRRQIARHKRKWIQEVHKRGDMEGGRNKAKVAQVSTQLLLTS